MGFLSGYMVCFQIAVLLVVLIASYKLLERVVYFVRRGMRNNSRIEVSPMRSTCAGIAQ